MKATTMLQGMLQMLDLMGEDAQVSIEVITDDGQTLKYPLKAVRSGTEIDGIILTNAETKK